MHPVFGVFYKVNVPVEASNGEDDEGEDAFATSTMCFRRKWHPRPVIKALTPNSVRTVVAVFLTVFLYSPRLVRASSSNSHLPLRFPAPLSYRLPSRFTLLLLLLTLPLPTRQDVNHLKNPSRLPKLPEDPAGTDARRRLADKKSKASPSPIPTFVAGNPSRAQALLCFTRTDTLLTLARSQARCT